MKRLVLIASLYALLALLLAFISMTWNPLIIPTIFPNAGPARPPALGQDLLPPLPVQTVTPDPNTSPFYASVKQALSSMDESSKLRGLVIKDWYGWVTSIARVGTTFTIGVVIGNPYTEDSTYYAVLKSSQENLRDLRLGQIVKFGGAIGSATGGLGFMGSIELGNADIQAIPEHELDLSDQPVPASLEVTLERTVCFGTCPAYKLKIRGDGTVIFSKDDELSNVPMLTVPLTVPVQTGTISHEKVAELLAIFRRVDYPSLKDSYEDYGWSDAPSAYTSITIDGRTKAVAHYQGDPSAPAKLTLLEDMIDDIVNTRQWLKD